MTTTPLKLILPTLLFLGLFASPTIAQDSIGFAISPPTFELTGNPGDTIKNTLRVENLNQLPVKLGLDVRNFTAIGEEGAVGLTEEVTSFSLASWLTLDLPNITIPSSSSRSIPFTITIPPHAEPGGHFGSIVVRTVPDGSISGSGAALSQELGALILLRVAGQVRERAQIVSFGATSKLYETGPVTFNLRIENKGSVHIKPKGTIVITNFLGHKVDSIELEGKNVLPGATRLMTTTWGSKQAFGRYTATLVGNYGLGNLPLTGTATFTVVPYRLLSLVLVLLIVVVVIMLRAKKRLKLAFKILFSGKA